MEMRMMFGRRSAGSRPNKTGGTQRKAKNRQVTTQLEVAEDHLRSAG